MSYLIIKLVKNLKHMMKDIFEKLKTFYENDEI